MPDIDVTLLPIASAPVTSVAGVIAALEALDSALPDADGLKWFNWLYLSVTRAVNAAVQPGQGKPWANLPWITTLDVVFARLYLNALRDFCTPGARVIKCWQALFDSRNDTRLARIQFAIAGINAHITHDLPLAVVQTCTEFAVEPRMFSPEYADYTRVNGVLDPLIDQAGRELQVGLLGDALPAIHLVEELIGSWSIEAVREAAWTNAEILWRARIIPGLEDRYLAGLDDTTAVASRGLLAPLGI